jgi:hypothetical protein
MWAVYESVVRSGASHREIEKYYEEKAKREKNPPAIDPALVGVSKEMLTMALMDAMSVSPMDKERVKKLSDAIDACKD